MKYKEMEHRKLKDLKKGDVIRMRVPYEENTFDYYNGYNPKDIRGYKFKDRFGNTSKIRMVIVIGCNEHEIMYLPLTSRHSGYDSKHQYELHDNSMTLKKEPDMKSYVEIHSLRALHADPEWDIAYVGRIMESDMVNIMFRLGQREIDFDSKRDQHAYVSQYKNEIFEKRLKEKGYVLSDKESVEKTYIRKDGRTVTKSKWGLVKYHVPLSKEQVTEMIANREGKPVDDFTKAIEHITEKSADKEREVI